MNDRIYAFTRHIIDFHHFHGRLAKALESQVQLSKQKHYNSPYRPTFSHYTQPLYSLLDSARRQLGERARKKAAAAVAARKERKLECVTFKRGMYTHATFSTSSEESYYSAKKIK